MIPLQPSAMVGGDRSENRGVSSTKQAPTGNGPVKDKRDSACEEGDKAALARLLVGPVLRSPQASPLRRPG